MRWLLITRKLDPQDDHVGFVMRWVETLAARLDHLDIICQETAHPALPPNVTAYSMGKESGTGRLAQARKFVRLLRTLTPRADAVLCHMIPRYVLFAAPWTRLHHKPLLFWYTHRQISPELRVANRLATRILTASPHSYPLPTDKLTVMGHGVDTSLFASVEAENTPPEIILVARLAHIKRQDKLIRAASQAMARGDLPPFRVVLAGGPVENEPGYRAQLEALARQLDPAPSVEFTGPLPHAGVAARLRQSAITINLSPPGLFDKSALEGMIAGKPTLVTNADFLPLLGDDADLLYLPDDARDDDLADRLARLLAMPPQERIALGAQLRERALAAHALEGLMERMAALIKTSPAKKRLVYVANNRLPTEKAHGLQIAQMCEALADNGDEVTLVTPRRVNTPEMANIGSLWEHYGIAQNFDFRRLPCLDLLPLFPRYSAAFLLQTFTYLLALIGWLLPRRVDVLYTRDLFLGAALRLTRPRTRLVYEVHQVHQSAPGRRLQGFLVRHAYVVPITAHLAEKMRALGATRVLVAHDGVRAARFEHVPNQAAARTALSLPLDAFLVGYVGRLHTMNMSKGLDSVVKAIAEVTQTGAAIDMLLVGGPESGIAEIRSLWSECGLPLARLHTVGQVSPEVVPRYLAALDVGTLPLPWTEHFAYYASALKLFEYMAAGCVVLASDLPSTAEVVYNDVSALLVPPGDVTALAGAIRRLYEDRDLCLRLSQQAQQDVQHYTWQARASRIREFLGEH